MYNWSSIYVLYCGYFAICYELYEILIQEGKEAYFVPNMINVIRQISVENLSNHIKEIIYEYTRVNIDLTNFNLQAYFDFLDTLSLLEESALLHILIFIFLLLCIFNFISVFFGNEIIKYFKLEERFPKLELYFKLRTKFQRYYLMWNIFTMLVVCIIGIGINLLVLY
uniref:LAGLIDADG endonuclease n=1 Tax=Trametes meyenii TaxID=526243 RepID=UPI003002CBCC|nr:LAGLIDADG endonuclease [Trametes meyenii]